MKPLFVFILILGIISSVSSGLLEEIVVDTKTSGLIAAFADFDSDRFTDVFYITDNGKSFHLMKSYEKKPELRQSANVQCSFNTTNEIIAGIIPGDFNGDAKIDLLVVTQEGKHSDSNHPKFNVWWFEGNRGSLNCNLKDGPILKGARSQPLVLDYNGDMVQDFLIETEDCKRELWQFSSTVQKFRQECLKVLNPDNVQKMAFPNSNAFVNIMNCRHDSVDFATDIVITGKDSIEYWIDETGYKVKNKIQVPYPGGSFENSEFVIGQSAFMDLNIDRCMEHILPVCKKHEGYIINGYCDPQILIYDSVKTKDWNMISNFDVNNSSQYYHEPIKSLFGYDLPFTARYGDVDGDGYVDLLMVLKSKKDAKNRAVILRNEAVNASEPQQRHFVYFWSSEAQIADEVEIASFLDVQENGKVDVLLTTRNSSNQYNIWWIRNTFMESKCFLKVLVTSGICHGSCPPDKGPYGTNTAGPFICYETSDVNGNLINGCDSQMTQSNHFALQLPYSIFGLGETPNFVETVFASIPSGEMKLRRSKWTQIVPDAQVVLIPYPPNETIYWISKLYYTPSPLIYSTLGTLGAICAFLLVIIFILHRRETLEDLSEHEEYKRHWPESR